MEGIQLKTNAKILILFANAYEMLTEDKKVMSGCSVHYLFWGEDGEELLGRSEWDVSKPVGIQRAKCSIDAPLRVKIPIAPALYEGTFVMTVGGDGKPVLRLQDVAYVSNVSVRPCVVEGLVVPGMVVPEKPAAAESAPADTPAAGTGKGKGQDKQQ